MARKRSTRWDDDQDESISDESFSDDFPTRGSGIRFGRKSARRTGTEDYDEDNGEDSTDSFGNSGSSERKKKFNTVMLIGSLILGAALWFGCFLLYGIFVELLPRPVTIGIVFGAFALGLGIGILLLSKLSGGYDRSMTPNRGRFPLGLFLLLASLGIGILAMGFQWIYGMHFNSKLMEPTSYIFVIDNSGSMADSDPDQLRYAAINEVLKDKPDDFPYMIYGFASKTQMLRPMLPKSEGNTVTSGAPSGQTAIRGSLKLVMEDYENKVWDGGACPKVILLTDGAATDIGMFRPIEGTLKNYNREKISISTVGLLYANESLMEQIASSTGGVFINIQDASQLSEAMGSAASSYSEDDLLTARFPGRLDFLFAILRVLFLTILGICLGYVKAVCYGQGMSFGNILVHTSVLSLAGALLLELLTALVGILDILCWFALWMLITVTMAHILVWADSGSGDSSGNFDSVSPRSSDKKGGYYGID